MSTYFGFDRGTPVDRVYIARFLERHAEDVRGRVLEVRDARYTREYGGDRVTSNEVVDVDPSNAEATLIADLAEKGSLPSASFDCAIVTQTLQYVSRPRTALENVWTALAPGGVALLTVPCASRIDPDLPVTDLWRMTPRGLETLLRQGGDWPDLEVTGYGNVLAAVAFLMGLAGEELREPELDENDPDFPLVVCARAKKSA